MLLLPLLGAAAELTSDVLSDEAGASGRTLGAEVVSATTNASEQRVIHIEIPELGKVIEDVRLVTPAGKEIQQGREAEITRRADGRKTGIRVYADREAKFEFRIKLYTRDDD